MAFIPGGYLTTILQWASKGEKSFFNPLGSLVEKIGGKAKEVLASIVNFPAAKRNEWRWNAIKNRINAFKTNHDSIDGKRQILAALEKDLLEIDIIGNPYVSKEEYDLVIGDYRKVCRDFSLLAMKSLLAIKPKRNSDSIPKLKGAGWEKNENSCWALRQEQNPA